VRGSDGTVVSCYAYRHLYGTGRWRVTSAFVIAKAGGVCEIRGPRCTGTATTADHVIAAFELAERGRLDLFFDTRYLRAACRSCNSRRGAIEENSRRRGRPRPRRRVVTAEQVAVEWAERERAYWARVEQERREAERPRRTPRIF
jgi:hypothetical protein